MSRSYKKTPICKDGNGSKRKAKTFANRRVRKYLSSHLDDNLSYKRYVKLYCQYDIADIISYYSKEQHERAYRNFKNRYHRSNITKEEWDTIWEEYYHRK